MKFFVEQIAIAPADPKAAMELLKAMGAVDWAHDHVTAEGTVFDMSGQTNEADLAFNYEIFSGKGEFEVLNYTDGINWVDVQRDASGQSIVSHLGMHCSAEDLAHWRLFFVQRNIKVVQEVMTQEHTNDIIAGKRWYNYVIFDTRRILGVDLKFIVRRDHPGKVGG